MKIHIYMLIYIYIYIYIYVSDRFGFHLTDSLSVADHAFASRVSMSFSVDELLLPWLVNFPTSCSEPLFMCKYVLFDFD